MVCHREGSELSEAGIMAAGNSFDRRIAGAGVTEGVAWSVPVTTEGVA